MILLLISALIVLCHNRHIEGFSHFKQEGWTRLFLISEDEMVHYAVGGYTLGVSHCDAIYLAPEKRNIKIDFFRGGEWFASQTLQIGDDDIWMRAPIQPQLNPVAHMRGLV